MTRAESEFRAILESAYAYFYTASHHTAAESVCEEYETACDENGVGATYDDETLGRLGIRLGMIAEASHEGHGLITACDWSRINRYAPLIAAPRESLHAAILSDINARKRVELERDDERMRDPAELAAAREYNRESLENR